MNIEITENDFRINEQRRLKELAGLIRVCGIPSAEIALGCKLDKRTVLRALKGLPLKSDAQARIEYYSKQHMINEVNPT